MSSQNHYIRICVFVLLVLLVSACSSGDPIVGKWKWKDSPLTVTFSEDGAFTAESDDGDKATGRYELTDQNYIRVVITDTGTLFKPTAKSEAVFIEGDFQISGDKLTISKSEASGTGTVTTSFEFTRLK
jgi:hypothetical protein